MKIAWQLFLCIAVTSGIVLFQMSDFALKELKPRYREAVEETLVDASQLLAATIGSFAEENASQLPSQHLKQALNLLSSKPINAQIYNLLKTSVDLRVSLVDSRGIVVFDSYNQQSVGSDNSTWRNIALTLRGDYGARTTRDNPDDPDSTVLYVSAPVFARGQLVGVLTLGKPTKSANYFIGLLRTRIVKSSIFMALGLIVLAAIFSRLVSRPIRQLTDYALAVSAGQNTPVPQLGQGEVGDLGRAFLEMKSALEGRAYIEEYVQNLTHELKSPIAAIRGAAELLEESDMVPEQRQRFVGNIASEAFRMQRIVERLLSIAAVENQTAPKLEVVSLNEVVGEVVESYLAKAEKHSVTIVYSPSAPVEVLGERFLIWQSVSNILDNALDFSPSGVLAEIRVEIRVEIDRERNFGKVVVVDQGPGVPEYARAKVCERFFSLPRPQTGKKSSGLGLSFVQAVVSLLGGSFSLTNVFAEDKQGATSGAIAVLSFPITDNNAKRH